MGIKPILFNTAMVRAILDGRKTMTRRVAKNPAMPICRKGDILYIRETWCKSPFTNHYIYRADGDEGIFTQSYDGEIMNDTTWKWHPSIHMPKVAARIWLKVTHVRLERLHDITNGEILKEGADSEIIESYIGQIPEEMIPDRESVAHKIAFSRLWDSTVKKADIDRYGWYANPYVWVIEFERCEKPEEV